MSTISRPMELDGPAVRDYPVSSRRLWNELRKLIHFPPNVTRCRIELDHERVASITCTYQPSLKDAEVTKTFTLREIDP